MKYKAAHNSKNKEIAKIIFHCSLERYLMEIQPRNAWNVLLLILTPNVPLDGNSLMSG